MPRISRITFCLIAVFLPSSLYLVAQSIKQPVSDPERQQLGRFEVALEKLREQLKIPAYSAAIVKNQAVIWARGFGYAELEKKLQLQRTPPTTLRHSRKHSVGRYFCSSSKKER